MAPFTYDKCHFNKAGLPRYDDRKVSAWLEGPLLAESRGRRGSMPARFGAARGSCVLASQLRVEIGLSIFMRFVRDCVD